MSHIAVSGLNKPCKRTFVGLYVFKATRRPRDPYLVSPNPSRGALNLTKTRCGRAVMWLEFVAHVEGLLVMNLQWFVGACYKCFLALECIIHRSFICFVYVFLLLLFFFFIADWDNARSWSLFISFCQSNTLWTSLFDDFSVARVASFRVFSFVFRRLHLRYYGSVAPVKACCFCWHISACVTNTSSHHGVLFLDIITLLSAPKLIFLIHRNVFIPS